MAGTFDAMGLPTGLVYSSEALWFHFLQGTSPYQPLRLLVDLDSVACGVVDVPFDDGLEAIRVPILYVAAAGGAGVTGLVDTERTASVRVMTNIVRLQSESDAGRDIGHVDIMLGDSSRELFWESILAFVKRIE